jgi:hypothetical protein
VTKRPALLRDAQLEVGLAVVLFLASMWLVNDAYEARGRKRPLAARLLP